MLELAGIIVGILAGAIAILGGALLLLFGSRGRGLVDLLQGASERRRRTTGVTAVDQNPTGDVVSQGTRVAEEIRDRVVEQGREQGQQLRHLEQQTDQIQETLDDLHYSTAPTAPTTTVRSLPSDERYQVDRPELAELARRLSSEQVVGVGGATGISGGGGVGKSLLAVRYARQNHSETTLYTSLDAGSVRHAMTELGLALGLPFGTEQTDAQVSRVLREALSQWDGLLILDNADDPSEVRMLLPNPGGRCRTIVTSRDEALLREVTEADPVALGEFSPEQAQGCFQSHLGEVRARQETGEIDRLCEMLGYLPQAVDVAAATIAAEGLAVSSWLKMYPDESRQLDALAPETAPDFELSAEEVRSLRIVRAVLRLSLRGLSNAARRLLYAVACFDPSDGGPEKLIIPVAQLEAGDQPITGRELNRLRQRSVLAVAEDQVGGRRFSLHRLMREVVKQEAAAGLGEYETRFFNIVAAFPEFLTGLVSDHQSTAAILAFHQEAANLERVAHIMVGDADPPAGITGTLPRSRAEFAAHVAQFTALRWDVTLRRRLLESAVRDSTEGEWNSLKADTLRALGDLDLREARLADARVNYEDALPIFRAVQSRLGEANTLQALGDLDLREDRLADARIHYDDALAIYQAVQARLGEANTLKALGDLDLREDRLADARTHYDDALPIYRAIQAGLGEANTLRALGNLDRREARLADARTHYDEALPIYQAVQDRLGEANTLKALGDLDRREARLADARTHYDEALPIFRAVQARLGEANTLQALALTTSLEGSDEHAVRGFQAALDIHRAITEWLGVRADWGYLGRHHLRNGRPKEALATFQSSLESLPWEADRLGYHLSLRGQLQAFQELKNDVGILACLRLLTDLAGELEEPYSNLLASIKQQQPDIDHTPLEKALAARPRNTVGECLGV